MKPFILPISVVLLAAALAGCSPTHAEDQHAPADVATASHYKEGRGLQLSPGAAAFVGLATAEVTARADSNAPMINTIPATALLRTVKGDYVYVANGGWYLRTPVTIGAAGSDQVEIKDGLYEGDIVVRSGVQALWLAELQAVNGGVGCADGH